MRNTQTAGPGRRVLFYGTPRGAATSLRNLPRGFKKLLRRTLRRMPAGSGKKTAQIIRILNLCCTDLTIAV